MSIMFQYIINLIQQLIKLLKYYYGLFSKILIDNAKPSFEPRIYVLQVAKSLLQNLGLNSIRFYLEN